uniref:L1 transposable element RRM domain-containing protein n=1 Tax=Amphilophus citrinellus TaxID=61819 RepID=A0A3Q0S3D6_AMPCI
MSTLRKEADKKSKSTTKKETSQYTEAVADGREPKDNMEVLLTELTQLRKEHTDASNNTKAALSRVELSLKDVLERTTKLEQQITDTNQRVSDTEDQLLRHDRVLRYMLQRKAKLSAKCEDLESRTRRNNLRIYGIPEGEEKNDMISFIIDMMRASLKLPQDMDLCVERAHRSLNMKPKDSAPPRSIIVRFSNYRVKEKIIQMAWNRRDVAYHGRKIYFDQDYTANIQKKRKQVREVIKQLKDKNVRAVSPFPAQLRIYLDSGTKTFTTLARAASTLEDLGIHIKVDEHERCREELLGNPWTTAPGKAGEAMLSVSDMQALLQGEK